MKRQIKAAALSIAMISSLSACGQAESTVSETAAQTELKTLTEAVSDNITEETQTEEAVQSEEETVTEVTPAEEEAPTFDTSVYYDILDRFFDIITAPEAEHDDLEGAEGIIEAAGNMGSAAALDNIGYAVEDISGDGIPELLVGSAEENGSDSRGTMIYAAYTIAEGEPRLIFEGWYRNCFRYCGDGLFFYEGSSGAASSAFGTLRLLPDGTALSYEDFYFTDWADDSFTELGVYRNTTGEWDISASEKTDMNAEEFWQLEEEMSPKEVSDIELTPLSELHASQSEEPPITVMWADDADISDNFDEYIISSSEPLSRIVFAAGKQVESFTILELTLVDVTDDGKPEFEAYPADTRISGLSPDRPLVVGLTFEGDIPRYGFQYEDENGDMRRFAIEISGEDGSLLIREADRDSFGFVIG